jgi:hypothetical protein
MTVGDSGMIQILPIIPVGIMNDDGFRLTPKQPEDLLVGDIGLNIKQMTLDLMMSSLKNAFEDIDTTLEKYQVAFDALQLFFDTILEKKTQPFLEQRYGPVLASNFGLAMNTMIAFFQLLKRKMSSIVLTDVTMYSDMIASILDSPIISSYSHDSEMKDPSNIPQSSEPMMHKMTQSIIFSCNIISFSTLVLLTMSLAFAESDTSPSQITQVEQLLRDWTLDVLIQLDESLDSELNVRGPFSISIPVRSEDHILAEMGLDDYLERLE